MTPIPAIITLLAALLLLGAGLLIHGLRGRRIDDHPICRRCRFDLIGLHGREPRCPECGSELDVPRAVRKGNRRRKPRLAVIGAVLFLAGLAPLAILSGGHAAGVNWNTYKPAWWLAAEARGGDVAAADAAMLELAQRLRSRQLNPDRTTELIELALMRQADRNWPWHLGFGTYLEAAREAALLSPDQLERYIRTSVHITGEAMERSTHGMPWTIMLRKQTRAGPGINWMVHIRSRLMEVNGRPIDDRTTRISAVSVTGGGSALIADSFSHPALLALEPGTHTIKVHAEIWIGEGSWEPSEALLSWDQTFTMDSQVRQPPAPPVRADGKPLVLVADESLHAAMESAIQIRNLRVEGTRADGVLSAAGSVLIRQPPAAAAFDIYWRFVDPAQPAETTEIRVGSMTATAGMIGGSMFGTLLPESFAEAAPPSVDVVLRPSLEAASRSADIEHIWDGTIILPDLAIRYAPAAEENAGP